LERIEILELHQLYSGIIYMNIANPEAFLKNNKLSSFEDKSHYSNNPVNIWKSKFSHNTVESFVEKFHIKYFYIKHGVVVPTYISKNAKYIYTSTITKDRFYVIK